MPRSITYTNPVWPHYFADPFVMRSGGAYWAYGTGPAGRDGRQFPVLRSDDLVHWKAAGHALAPIEGARPDAYWAPEVAERDGRFFLYYSASTSASDADQRLRVATSDRPEGPFVDSGRLLLPDQGFSIDAHPFRDPRDGTWYLYFATDYLEDEPHGTGLAAARLAPDMLGIAGPVTTVVRASCDWQIYERDRDYKGRRWRAWHCVEGPFVVPHGGRYYCLYSGGAWHTESYGLGFAVADHPLGPWADERAKLGSTVLKGVPDRVLGPGHNSVVVGPDDRTLFAVYHAWDPNKTARRMCIDPIDWTDHGPVVRGPSVGEKAVELGGSVE
ncbi:MAG TPA: glycoside hydrolase family 43 protein [Tepidisphaeraceae bacterium]|nr:glycoside hydrolase family 43 protein [Tepidisphaeraceae bacterium]